MLISDLDRPRALLLDTHLWIWASGNRGGLASFASWIAPKIEAAARERRLFVCAASVWEIALKAQRGELLVTGDLRRWVHSQRIHPCVRILVVNSTLAIDATVLPPWTRKSDGKPHKDPCDRFLVAAARHHGAVLLTCDELIVEYAREGHVLACDARR